MFIYTGLTRGSYEIRVTNNSALVKGCDRPPQAQMFEKNTAKVPLDTPLVD